MSLALREHVVYRRELAHCRAPLGLRSVGHAVFPPGHATGARRIDFIQLLWTVAGEGRVRLGQQDCPVRRDWAVLCLPESVHRLAAGNDGPWEYRWCTVDGPLAASLLAAFQLPLRPFAAGPCPSGDFTRLERALRNAAADSERAASVEAYRFVAQAAGLAAAERNPAPDPKLQQLLSGISAEIGAPGLNVQALAERAEMSRGALHRHFRRSLGMPPKQYLDSIRLQTMLSLLRDSDRPLAEIARATGFANANYLAKFFRKKRRCSPSQFRQAAHLP